MRNKSIIQFNFWLYGAKRNKSVNIEIESEINMDTNINNESCMGCLCKEETLIKITDLNELQFYLDIVGETQQNISQVLLKMCVECTENIKHYIQFRDQVKRSYNCLTSSLTEQNIFSESSDSANMRSTFVTALPVRRVYTKEEVMVKQEGNEKNSDTECNNLYDTKYTDSEEDQPIATVKKRKKKTVPKKKQNKLVKDSIFMTEGRLNKQDGRCKKEEVMIKMEMDIINEKDNLATDNEDRNPIDSDMDEPISKIKEEKANNKSKKSSKQLSKQLKIKTIDLTAEEMEREREAERQKETYIHAPYKCERCILGFRYANSFNLHVSSKHKQSLGEYSCPVCETVVASVDSFTAHYKRHMRRYECGICSKRSADLKAMHQHYYAAHDISLKTYKCHICQKTSNSIDAHRYHLDSHKARVKCDSCDKTFSHRAGLMNHRLAFHTAHAEHPCGACGLRFRWRASLQRHMRKHDDHTKQQASGPQASCASCDITFACLSSYRRHMNNSLRHVTHDDLRFICDHCGRKYADKTKLRSHIEEKHLHKTYECQICHKPSRNLVGLDQHMRNVHRGRKHNMMCHHCGKGFATKLQLESHIRTHTGERPFICEYCPTTFSQQSNLYKHNRQVHMNIKSKKPHKKETDTAANTQLQIAVGVDFPADVQY